MKTPTPTEFDRCTHCGKPVQKHEAYVASKHKRCGYWVFAHKSCAFPKNKPQGVAK